MSINQSKREIAYGETLFQNGKLAESLNVFEYVLENHPDDIDALNNKGVVLNQLEEFEKSISIFYHILSIEDSNSNAIFNLISNFISLGNWKCAERELARHGDKLSKPDLTTLISETKRIKAIKSNEYSMKNTAIGSNVRTFNYRIHQDRINKIFEKKIFFIVGCPKSGTTWLQNLLDGHSDIYCPGESNVNLLLRFLNEIAESYNKDIIDINDKYIGHNNGYALLTKDNLDYLFCMLLGLLFSNLDASQTVDCIGTKNPDHMKSMNLSAHLIPNVKYVHIIRDGRDVAVSGMFHNLRINPKGFKNMFPKMETYVESIAKTWAADIRTARFLAQSFPDRYAEIRYEDLQKDPYETLHGLLEFLNVKASNQSIDQCLRSGAFEVLTKGRPQGREDRASFFRKGIVGDWKNHFSKQSFDIFMSHSGDLLRDLKYE